MKKEKVLFFDSQQYDATLDHTQYVCKGAVEIFELWNKVSIMPKFEFAHLKGLTKSGSTYFMEVFTAAVKKQTIQRLGDDLAAIYDFTSFKPPIDLEILDKVCSGFAATYKDAGLGGTRVYRGDYRELLKFDESGRPYIDDETIEEMKIGCTIYETPENKRRYSNFTDFATLYNTLLKDYGLSDPLRSFVFTDDRDGTIETDCGRIFFQTRYVPAKAATK